MRLCEWCGEEQAVSEVESEHLCQACIDDWLGVDDMPDELDNNQFNEALSKANLALMDLEYTLKNLDIPASLDSVYETMNLVTKIAAEEGYVIQ